MQRISALAVCLFCLPLSLSAGDRAAEPWRVLPEGEKPDDARLGKLRTLRDDYHPWTPPESRAAWEKERQTIREQVLVGNGLWPLPPKKPLKPVVHGTIDRGEYTVEKVYFASHPGHYVTGNLYRPKKIAGKAPGVLCPHGHWSNGRFYDAGEKKARQQIEKGAEEFLSGARYPVQARMAQLARMGCVVFHYDMVGYADSKQIPHRQGFTDAQAGLRLQNFMGLQTFNSIRALDFLLSLAEVDPERIGVTGSSGGGTQTFMICAVDDRPDAAFPAVMVSTAMQGGCICENAEYLRIGINNIAIAALFAPKPLAMSGADDWTIDIETKGLPELRRVYSFYGRSDHVQAKAWPEFKHNYNQRAREMMYNFFNEHLKLGLPAPVKERDFEPVPPKELSVFDEKHTLPDDAVDAAGLRDYLTKASQQQYRSLLKTGADGSSPYRRVVGTAARVMLGGGLPRPGEVAARSETESLDDGITLMKGLLVRSPGRSPASQRSRASAPGERVPFVVLVPGNFEGRVVLWIDGRGKRHLFGENGRPKPAVRRLLNAGRAVASIDAFLTGEFLDEAGKPRPPDVHETYHGYTFGYNRPLLANRVRDVLASISAAANHPEATQVELVGTGEAGAWVLLARALAGDAVENTLVDLGGFDFGDVKSVSDPMFLPGALKYGGIGGLAALAPPARLRVFGTKGAAEEELQPLRTLYAAAPELQMRAERLSDEEVVRTLLGE